MKKKVKDLTKEEILDLFKKHLVYDGSLGDDCKLDGITIQILSDEKDYPLFLELLKPTSKRTRRLMIERNLEEL